MSESMIPPSRAGWVGAFAVAVVAVVGFFTGTRGPVRGPTRLPPSDHGAAVHAHIPAGGAAMPRYDDMRNADFRANSALYTHTTELLRAGVPDPLAPVELTDEERARAIADRKKRRAYDGAPPTIPHGVGQREPTGCLVCHERGARVGELLAPAMSHQRYALCLQCHVALEAPGPTSAENVAPANTFEGIAYGKGSRAWAGAPPTTPHPTSMRGECTSCHGPASKLGLRSSHPWRVNCEQCHAPSAALDQRAAASLENTP